MSKRRRVVREYPDTWDSVQEGRFIGELRDKFNIPYYVRAKYKVLPRRGMIRVTWKWTE